MLNLKIIYVWALLGVIVGLVGLTVILYDKEISPSIDLEKTTYDLSKEIFRDIVPNPIKNYFVDEVVINQLSKYDIHD